MDKRFIVPLEGEGPFTHLFYCPGCKCSHGINVDPARGEPCWTGAGPPEAPTVRPSVRVRSSNAAGPTVCHLFITDGQIQYLQDCTHELAGQTVPMEEN